MSIVKTSYIVICNDCGAILKNSDGTTRRFDYNVTAIQVARESGWAVNQKGDTDYCPRCKDKHINNQESHETSETLWADQEHQP